MNLSFHKQIKFSLQRINVPRNEEEAGEKDLIYNNYTVEKIRSYNRY